VAIYIPRSRIREASGGSLKESHIGFLLHRRGLLVAKPEKDRFCIKWVPKVGRSAPTRCADRNSAGQGTSPTRTSLRSTREVGMTEQIDLLAALDAAIERLRV
jgi:hypothetical protein